MRHKVDVKQYFIEMDNNRIIVATTRMIKWHEYIDIYIPQTGNDKVQGWGLMW